MTNQEAAEMIRNDMKLHHDSLSGGYRKALSMAIAALEAQEIRDLLIVSPLLDKKKKKRKREAISAQPETGYWISARDEDGRHMWLICSECKAKETNLKAKYCPVCGRKMA